jgi:hypothetical protein
MCTPCATPVETARDAGCDRQRRRHQARLQRSIDGRSTRSSRCRSGRGRRESGGCRLSSCAPGAAAAAARSAGQWPLGNFGGGEPGGEGGNRTEFGAALRQPLPGALGVLIVFAPEEKEFDAIGVICEVVDPEVADFAGPERRGKSDQEQGAIAQSR